MATTTVINCSKRGNTELRAYPVKAGEYIYQGALACVKLDGYLYNFTAAIAAAANPLIIGFVADGSENGNLTAPSASGSISGNSQKASDVSNGEKTVRSIWITGEFEVTFDSIAQTNVGCPVYAKDNNAFSITYTAGCTLVGYLSKYISATKGWVELVQPAEKNSGVIKFNLTAAGDGTAGAVAAVLNPVGKTIMVTGLVLDVTTAPTDTAGGVDAGIAANATTSSDTLIDGLVLAAAGTFDSIKNAGTNGASYQKMTSGQYLTVTSVVGSHLDLAAAVGTGYLFYTVI
jgi:hypothetical protein